VSGARTQSLSVAVDPLLERRSFGPFAVEALLGEGGSSRVYRVRRQGEVYALKLPRIACVLAPEGRARLEREARIASALNAPGIVVLHETGVIEGRPYLLYAYVDGAPLHAAWRGVSLAPRVRWVRDAARAVGLAHAEGVIHRDIKPQNVLVTGDGRVWITDFGLGWSSEEASLTATGEVLGTPLYLAPEQALDGKFAKGPLNDVWSLGVVLYEALTGEHPYSERGLIAALHAGLPLTPGPGVPEPLARACAKALSFDPTARQATGEALAAELDPWLAARVPDELQETIEGSSPTRAAQTPARIASYEIVGTLGQGGMGMVYLARGAEGEEVAIKTIRETSDEESSERRRKRFIREGMALRELDHPGIVRFRDAGSEGDLLYVVMDRLVGMTLEEHLETRGALSSRDTAKLGRRLAAALSCVHALGIVHRDLKPENVFLTEEGVPRLTDFGLAEFGDAQGERLTRTGSLLGTPGYMAPEQAGGGEASPATDVYGLGAVLYACLTRIPPIQAAGLAEFLVATVEHEPRPPRELAPDLDPRLEAVVLRCLRKQPSQRYPHMDALALALEAVLSPPSRVRRRGTQILGAALALGLGAFGVSVGITRVRVSQALEAARGASGDAALARWSAVLALSPDHAEALRGRTRAHLGQAAWKEALQDAERLVELLPKDPSALELRADVLGTGLDQERARADLRAALELDDRRAGTWGKLAELLLRSGDSEGGERAAGRALTLDEGIALALYVRGVSRHRRAEQRRDAELRRAASTDLSQALRLGLRERERSSCLSELALCFLELDQESQALELLDAHQSSTTPPVLRKLRCLTQLLLGQPCDARAELQELSRSEGGFDSDLYILASMGESQEGQLDGARDLLLAALRDPAGKSNPRRPYLVLWAHALGARALDVLGLAKRDDLIGHTARLLSGIRSESEVLSAVQAFPPGEQGFVRCFVGLVRERAGDVEGACAIYEESLTPGQPVFSLHRVWAKQRLRTRCQPALP
jgi:serine/threonine protein kinase/tetratricopeptide (TPR) repeat protein